MILKHAALVCSSEDNADRFYVELLGLTKREPKILPSPLSRDLFDVDSDLEIINYVGDDIHLEVFILDRDRGDAGRIEHLCLEVDDVEGLVRRCRAMEVKVVRVPRGERVLTFISDDDGNLFEIKGKTL